jgi:hypothetical protein
MKLLIMQSSPASCHFLPLRSRDSPEHPVLKHPPSVFLPERERDQVTHQNNIAGKITVTYILVFKFLDDRRKEKNILN